MRDAPQNEEHSKILVETRLGVRARQACARSFAGRALACGGFGACFDNQLSTCAAPGALPLEFHRGAQKCQPEAMRRFWARGQLWLEQSSNEEAMIWQLYRANFSLHTARADAKSGGLKLLFVFVVHSVVAVILFGIVVAAADGMKASAWQNFQSFVTGGLRAAFAPIRQAAGKRSDNVMGRTGIVFRTVRVGNLQNIPRIL
jgi:hypothetical protein